MYRQEHPKPQFERKNWLNLNGQWAFAFDFGNSAEERELYKDETFFDKTINVPFCVESELSGIGYKSFMDSVWYKRTVSLTKEQIEELVRLHFGAVDYKTTVFINGVKCGTHQGGYVSFFVDVTPYVKEGENEIIVHAEDDTRSWKIPSGKQSADYYSKGCYYTRTTGIWQTVWLEFLPERHIESVKYYSDIENGILTVKANLCGKGTLRIEASFDEKPMGMVEMKAHGGEISMALPLKEKHLWEVGKGGLYDLKLTYGKDEVKSYFGLRSLRLDGYKFLINEKSVFQRLVLDQGFYPTGLYTAPNEMELIADIDRSIAMGFNGARLHEKVFEERFLYHCDKKGYIVWGEYPNWGYDIEDGASLYPFLHEWLAEVERDFNHPSIVGWCPFNETWGTCTARQSDELIYTLCKLTKMLDPERPIVDASGGNHAPGAMDIYDLHDYSQDPTELKKHFEGLAEGKVDPFFKRYGTYPKGMPFFVSEYGGIRRVEDDGWGYGNATKTEKEGDF